MSGTRAEQARSSIASIDRQIEAIGVGATSLSAASLRDLSTMLRIHAAAVRNARSDLLAIRGPVWRSLEAVSRHLATCICPLVLDRFERLLPIDDNAGGRRLPDEASVVDYAEAVAALFAWEATVGRHVLLRAAIKKRLAAVAEAVLARIEEHLRLANDADIPDFRRLGREILRAEVAEWALRLAGAPEHSAAILQRANRVAREAITWAARVFDRFRSAPDELTHFDAAATLTAVDDLLLVILRVHDSDQLERAAGSHPFVLTIGEQTLQEFCGALERMTGRYLQIAEQHLLSDGAAGAFVLSVLRVLDRILRVGHLLQPVLAGLRIEMDHAATVARMRVMRERLKSAATGSGAPRDHALRLALIEGSLGIVGP